MLISCKCLNFVATSPQLQRSQSIAGSVESANGNNNINNYNNNSSANAAAEGAGEAALPSLLLRAFAAEVPRDFAFYTTFMDFFNHPYGPISDLTVNAINQRDLIYSRTLQVDDGQTWQLSICMNCKVVICAKRLKIGANTTPTQYIINSTLLTSNEELAHRRNHKSYSETFGLLIMDHDDSAGSAHKAATTSPSAIGIANSASSLSIGSHSMQAPMLNGKQQRLRQLQAHQQARIQAEINETNERIERFTEQNFALLKSFRERCDQEAALLARVVQELPEHASELLDRSMPVALEVTGGVISYATGPGGRRRNTISSRRELGVPTTPTTPMLQAPFALAFTQYAQQQQKLQQQQPQQLQQQQPQQLQQQQPQQQAAQQLNQQQPPLPGASIITTRKMSNFDTPPATPEATPMSVGNSPTFRQQQQQATTGAYNSPLLSTPATSTGADDADDCLFDLEDVDGTSQTQGQTAPLAQNFDYPPEQHNHKLLQQQYHHNHHQHQHHHQHHDNMSDADEAEDALDLDSSLSIPMRGAAGRLPNNFANFARSLPVEIANSPLAERANNNHLVLEDEEVLDNTVDIAASIKALAKSVHGEAVFGDLPRPRLRSQI